MSHPSWVRYRFQANYEDWRPVIWPPAGPYWCSGYAMDESYATIVAYAPAGVDIKTYWPEAAAIDSEPAEDGPRFTDRFPKPSWWPIDE